MRDSPSSRTGRPQIDNGLDQFCDQFFDLGSERRKAPDDEGDRGEGEGAGDDHRQRGADQVGQATDAELPDREHAQVRR